MAKVIKVNDNVIFKQRTARHLSCSPNLPWEYENGSVVHINEENKTANLCWAQGHHSRNDDVPLKDIVAIHKEGNPVVKIGVFKGASLVLQEIVEEGAE